MMAWLNSNMALVITGSGWVVSEILAMLPSAKSSSVLQLVANIGASIFDALKKAIAPAA